VDREREILASLPSTIRVRVRDVFVRTHSEREVESSVTGLKGRKSVGSVSED